MPGPESRATADEAVFSLPEEGLSGPPRRGDIYYADISRGAKGHELGAAKGKPLRCGVVVSADSFNNGATLVTIAPFREYHDRHELRVNWGFRLLRHRILVNDGHPINKEIYYDASFVDCGQLTTLTSFPPRREGTDADRSAAEQASSQIRFEYGYARLPKAECILLNTALQVAIGDTIKSSRRLPAHFGDVIELEVGPRHERKRERHVIVSSSGIDLLRERETFRDRRLGLIMAVPLRPLQQEDRGLVRMQLVPKSKNVADEATVLCTNINTFDWRFRNGAVVGRVRDMTTVMREVYRYLGLHFLVDGEETAYGGP